MASPVLAEEACLVANLNCWIGFEVGGVARIEPWGCLLSYEVHGCTRHGVHYLTVGVVRLGVVSVGTSETGILISH